MTPSNFLLHTNDTFWYNYYGCAVTVLRQVPVGVLFPEAVSGMAACILFYRDHKTFPGVDLHEIVTSRWRRETLPINSNARLVILSLSNLNHENLFFMNNSEIWFSRIISSPCILNSQPATPVRFKTLLMGVFSFLQKWSSLLENKAAVVFCPFDCMRIFL